MPGPDDVVYDGNEPVVDDLTPVEPPAGEPDGDVSPEGDPGAGGDEPPAPEPKLFSHDDAKELFEHGIGRLEDRINQRIEHLLTNRLAAAQPQTPPDQSKEQSLFPTTNAEMEQMLQDPWGWVEMTKKAHGTLVERLEALEGNFTEFRSGYEKHGRTQQVIKWLDDQCMEAIDGLDSFVTEKGEVDPEMYSALKAMVTGYIQQNKGARGLNVKALAKSMHDRINRVVDARYKKKIKPPDQAPPPAKPKGSSSRPKVEPPKSREAATEGFRATIAAQAKGE